MAGKRMTASHQLSRSRRVLRTAGMGREDPFPRPGPSGRCRFSQTTFAGTHCNERDAPTAAIRRAANNEGPWDHPVTTLVSRTGRDLVAAPGGDLGTPCAARSARARRATPSTLNRCRARSADSLASDACSRYRIGAEATQSRRGKEKRTPKIGPGAKVESAPG